jgi:hypothetical protein
MVGYQPEADETLFIINCIIGLHTVVYKFSTKGQRPEFFSKKDTYSGTLYPLLTTCSVLTRAPKPTATVATKEKNVVKFLSYLVPWCPSIITADDLL